MTPQEEEEEEEQQQQQQSKWYTHCFSARNLILLSICDEKF
jgi:hypothetical protein